MPVAVPSYGSSEKIPSNSTPTCCLRAGGGGGGGGVNKYLQPRGGVNKYIHLSRRCISDLLTSEQ